MSFTPAKGVVVCDLHAEVAQSASKGGIDDAPQLTFSMLRRSKRFALYGVIMSGLALVWVGITVPDPYLLPWADSRGLMGWQAGILFSAQPLAVVLIQPAIPALARQPGYLGLLPFGLVLAALASAGIAAAPSWGGSGTKLFLILVISDLIAGTAEGIVETCSYTLLAKSFNDVLGQAVGHAEAWIGIGTFAGPFIGGVLFSLGGFSCPSAALSVALFALTAWTMFTTNANLNCYSCLAGGEADQKTQEDDEKRIWRADGIVFVAAATSAMLSGSVTGIYAPLLSEYYTRDFMWSEAFVGQLFALSGAIYMTVASLVGHYCDRGGPVALRNYSLWRSVRLRCLAFLHIRRTFAVGRRLASHWTVHCNATSACACTSGAERSKG